MLIDSWDPMECANSFNSVSGLVLVVGWVGRIGCWLWGGGEGLQCGDREGECRRGIGGWKLRRGGFLGGFDWSGSGSGWGANWVGRSLGNGVHQGRGRWLGDGRALDEGEERGSWC